jgi:two-component system CheB/CheR fusion protein
MAPRKSDNGKGSERQSSRASATPPPTTRAQGKPQELQHPSCPVVGVGASAGGLEAFQAFLSRLPDDTGFAFVLVQHLSPQHKSMLDELLRRHTKMPVAEIQQDTRIEPDRIYVIPPNTTLTVEDNRLHLSPAKRRDGRMPIDDFFRSLAEARGEKAACVILSGTGSDGTLGLRAIKEHGGLSLAQAEESARYDGMLRSAIATGLVDYVLPAEEMPVKLVEYFQHLREVDGQKDADGVRKDTSDQLGRILAVLSTRTRHDFSGYKEKTVARRVQRRMQALQVSTPDQYIKRLRSEPREIELLFQDLLIGVTNFFRDADAFHALAVSVLPQMMRNSSGQVRVWVPGCATGEEAYSIGILLREGMAHLDRPPKLQIFATDIDENALETARLGRYSLSIELDVSSVRLERFFVKEEGAYRVTKELREMCIFSAHNVLRDPPFSKLGLVSCRNLLIYLNPPLQSQLLRTFHYALRPDGFLLLGNTESVAQQPALFTVVDKAHHIYGWKPHADTSVRFPLASAQADGEELAHAGPRAEAKKSITELAERFVLNHGPAYVVINGQQQVLSFSARTGKYLEPPAGAPNTDLLSMARPGLRLHLRAVVHKAIQASRRMVQSNVPVEVDGVTQIVNIIIQPFNAGTNAGDLFVVIFQDVAAAKLETVDAAEARDLDSSGVQQLEHELRLALEQRQTITEELEAANEELKSSNEELSSMNEELQSMNEELETSKEELQSINEELQTVNAQVQTSNEELRRANSDLKNLLESTQIATMFLDNHLKIKSFTPSMVDIFYVTAADQGRPIGHIRARPAFSDLEPDCRRVLRTLSIVEREVSMADRSAHYAMRIVPYRTIDNVIDGVVLTFFDVTERKRREEERGLLAAIVDSSNDAIISVSLDGLTTSWNAAAERLYGYTAQEAIGRPFSMLVPPDRMAEVALIDERVMAGERVDHLETVRVGKNGRPIDVSIAVSPVRDASGGLSSISVIVRDLSDRKRAELQRIMLAELNHRVKNSFAVVSALARRTLRTSPSPAAFVAAFEGRLKAFGRTHNALSQERWVGIGIAPLVTNELQPYKGRDQYRTAVSGPPVLLRPRAALALGMTIHELASNAVKFGALSTAGRVEVFWQVIEAAPESKVVLHWREGGGPRVTKPTHKGLGRRLIEEMLAYELGARVALSFQPEGLRCTIEFPLSREIGELPPNGEPQGAAS